MSKYNIFILSFCAFIFSCAQTTSVNTQNDKYPEFFSIEKKLINNGVLKVNLPKARPKNMSIMSPNKTWYIIQSKADSIEIIPNKQFMTDPSIEFSIPALKGVTWIEGKKYIEKVFVENGEYFIYFANNLETEPENTFSFSQKIIYEKN